MNHDHILVLDENDPLVAAAIEAETRLYAFYGLQPKTHFVTLPHSPLRVRVFEI
jgi:hypothetical protein